MDLITKEEFNGLTLNVYGTNEEPLFKVKEIGEILGMVNIYEVLRSVPDKLKKTIIIKSENGVKPPRKTVYIKEPALYRIAFRSNKEIAKKFVEFVTEEVLPSIRRTGQYTKKEIKKYIDQNKCFEIQNENDLHKKVISFIHSQEKKRNLDLDIIIPNGELQDTSYKRLESYKKGFQSGQPDIIINNCSKKFNSLCIELKNPKGTGIISDKQKYQLNKKTLNRNKVLISNDYDEIIETIINYLNEIRLRCPFCTNKFKNNDSRIKHLKYFHKILDINI